MNSSRLVKLMESHHELFHLLFGAFSLVTVVSIFPSSDIYDLIFWALVGSFLPDFDHVLSIFIYGRSSEYSTQVRACLSKLDLASAIHYIRRNHKSNYYIFSHNLLTPILSFGLFGYFLGIGQAQLSSLSLSWAMHFIFDIVEDYLALGHLNSNWFFHFSSKLRQRH